MISSSSYLVRAPSQLAGFEIYGNICRFVGGQLPFYEPYLSASVTMASVHRAQVTAAGAKSLPALAIDDSQFYDFVHPKLWIHRSLPSHRELLATETFDDVLCYWDGHSALTTTVPLHAVVLRL